ncbi:MAG: cytochrome ubiquinol oxidase subunit I [Gemmatimonadaceae bacterium]
MTNLLAARSQMAVSLGFHIIFAVIGIGMPLLMVLAEGRHQRTGDPVALELAKRWAKGTSILFAVGAVSGTVLSFELGLLWPGFMRFAGAIIGMPFSLEGFAFFAEAIFLGVYLYGWSRITPRAHLLSGVAVAVSGTASGVFVIMANAWMNAPVGFHIVNGRLADIDPLRGMMSPAAFPEALHMTIAAFAATGMGVAGIHAVMLLRHPGNVFHERAVRLALLVGAPAALLQPVTGDVAARFVAAYQPTKLAAMEGQFTTMRGAPLRIGGLPNVARGETPYAFEVPRGLSWLATHDPTAEIRGLNAYPRRDWPPVLIVHLAFQLMVALGTISAGVALWSVIALLRRRELTTQRALLAAVSCAAPLGFLAIEAGWVVTEVGRQPWIVYGVLRTADALTPMPGLVVPFLGFSALYVMLGAMVCYLLWRQVVRSPDGVAADVVRLRQGG